MLPVTLITGFLGSGKTTLLNFLLKHAALKNSLVVINEFGEIAIDHLIVSAPAENVRLLSNGCMCCQVRGELVDTLNDVAQKRRRGELSPFERILIETSGLADPVPILQTIVTDDRLSLLLHLDAVITVIDAIHVLRQLSVQDEIRKQIAVADLLLVSKTDLPSAATLPELELVVRRINGGAEILPVTHGAIDPTCLLGLSAAPRRDRSLLRWVEGARPSGSADGHGLHAGDIQTFSLFLEEPVSKPGLIMWLSMLAHFRGAQLLRVKGIVNVVGKPHIIHAVQTVIHEPIQLDAWPTADERTRIVFIVRGLDRGAISKTLEVFGIADSLDNSPGARIDPAAYALFRETARHFIDAPKGKAQGS